MPRLRSAIRKPCAGSESAGAKRVILTTRTETPAGWASGISIDQEIKNFLQRDPPTRTRFGSLEFGVMVPDHADTWTRMVYAGPNKPIAPIAPKAPM